MKLYSSRFSFPGYERPGYFLQEGTAHLQKYDWYGYYGHEKNKNTCYVDKLSGDYKFEFSDHHDLVIETLTLT